MKNLGSVVVVLFLGIVALSALKVAFTSDFGQGTLLMLGIAGAIIFGIGGSIKNALDDDRNHIYRFHGSYKDQKEVEQKYRIEEQSIERRYPDRYKRGTQDEIEFTKAIEELRSRRRFGPPGKNF